MKFNRLLGMGILVFAQSLHAASGTIMAIDIQERTIQIDSKKFGLADKLQVWSEANLISQSQLKAGQRIQYETAPQSLNLKDLPKDVIKSIHIESGLDEEGSKLK